MKLLFCISCNETFNLGLDYKECAGKHGGGKYVTNNTANIWGSKQEIIVLGFANSSFHSAVVNQANNGDLVETLQHL
jgi:hypothetical protein